MSIQDAMIAGARFRANKLAERRVRIIRPAKSRDVRGAEVLDLNVPPVVELTGTKVTASVDMIGNLQASRIRDRRVWTVGLPAGTEVRSSDVLRIERIAALDGSDGWEDHEVLGFSSPSHRSVRVRVLTALRG